ncbi:type II and III secretion system protein family protein [Alcaligenes endophyticus]|uniref:Type IV pilus biogenesis and competence protein PilQ n=1 Tax=Alcaligenes endophyticus TaxID=1929088 RepID=A0ABT8EK78_9BURK|nr:pilus assembly protein N-terminal domain-containing protein [Alcaligenes endophyticus]MCX5592002.1 pilus assembly protein N-terminal domain-containing protein [Alcaligenes endophyticus]MDN4121692.1 pilus assembly protein N-terminal domain-containing protein [Alcaligenes endophyticus]
MSKCRSVWLALSLWLFMGPLTSAWASQELRMQVGELTVLGHKTVERVAVGDGQIINAMTTQDHELILFARQQGHTGLQVWTADGKVHQYTIEVAAENARQSLQELKHVLERIPNLRLSQVGGRLVLEGEQISDEDRERLTLLSQHYPQLLDFTSQMGWEPMVMLDVQVLELPRHAMRDLGIRWNPHAEGGINAGLAWDAGSRHIAERPGESVLPIHYPTQQMASYFGVSALLSARLQVMAQEGYAVVLAQPQLLARSGAQAEFLAGGEIPYLSTDKNGNSHTVFKPYGVALKIVPRIERGGAVRSKLEVEVSSVDPSVSSNAGPAMKTRRAASEFNVRSGQTLVLAGFISREESSNIDKVPGLGSLPVLGHLFRSERFQRHETELAIFVTPTVVQAEHPDLMQRVGRGQAIVDQYFDASTLNNPVYDAPSSGSSSQWIED